MSTEEKEAKELADESSPLTIAIAMRDVSRVKELLTEDPSLVENVGQYGDTPLMRAVQWVRPRILQAERYPTVSAYQDGINKSIDIVNTILTVKQDLDVKNKRGHTAHKIAVDDRLFQIAAMIEEKGKQAGGRRSSHRRRSQRRRRATRKQKSRRRRH